MIGAEAVAPDPQLALWRRGLVDLECLDRVNRDAWHSGMGSVDDDFLAAGGIAALAFLGLEWSATAEDARQVLRKAGPLHPDRGGGGAFARVAWAVDLVRRYR